MAYQNVRYGTGRLLKRLHFYLQADMNRLKCEEVRPLNGGCARLKAVFLSFKRQVAITRVGLISYLCLCGKELGCCHV